MFKQENKTNTWFYQYMRDIKRLERCQDNFKKDRIKPTIDFSQRKYIEQLKRAKHISREKVDVQT